MSFASIRFKHVYVAVACLKQQTCPRFQIFQKLPRLGNWVTSVDPPVQLNHVVVVGGVDVVALQPVAGAHSPMGQLSSGVGSLGIRKSSLVVHNRQLAEQLHQVRLQLVACRLSMNVQLDCRPGYSSSLGPMSSLQLA